MKFYGNPQFIATARVVDKNGNDKVLGDKIVNVQAVMDDGNSFEGTIQIDVHDFPEKGKNLILDVSLPELLQAIGSAAINRDKS